MTNFSWPRPSLEHCASWALRCPNADFQRVGKVVEVLSFLDLRYLRSPRISRTKIQISQIPPVRQTNRTSSRNLPRPYLAFLRDIVIEAPCGSRHAVQI